MNYKKYTNKDIVESYTTALNYSNKVDKDLLAEIESRGGIDNINRSIIEQNIVPDEIKRVRSLVYQLYVENPNPNHIKSSISSNILDPVLLSNTIEIAISGIGHHVEDISINSRTIYGCIIGIVISSLIGSGLWCVTLMLTGKMYYILSAAILLFSYFIIRFFTRKSNNNVLVFIATFASAFISIPLGLLLFSLLTINY